MPDPSDGEDGGLRAFAVEVGAYAGAAYPERPEWVLRGGRRLSVIEVLAAWREEERIGFRVRLEDGLVLLLYYVPELDLWSGVPFVQPPRRAARRKDQA